MIKMKIKELKVSRAWDGGPVVIHKKNRRPILVTMLFDDWIELYKVYISKEKGDMKNENISSM